MAGYTLTAIYRSRIDAEKARVRLIKEGVPVGDIRVVTAREAAARRSSVLSRSLSEGSHEWYRAYLHGDRAAVSVRTHNSPLRQRAAQILEALNPLDEDEIAAGAPTEEPADALSGAPSGQPVGRQVRIRSYPIWRRTGE
ncbi:MAG TPA: hypothetical protein VE993_08230 [Stellaceae bacterium]|nr:hypothetical protein [Stellaceae bacterium]